MWNNFATQGVVIWTTSTLYDLPYEDKVLSILTGNLHFPYDKNEANKWQDGWKLSIKNICLGLPAGEDLIKNLISSRRVTKYLETFLLFFSQ